MATKTPTQRRRPPPKTPRRLVQGDIAPRLTDQGIADFSVREAVSAANESKAYAVGDILQKALRTDGVNAARDSLAAILKGASPDDVAQLRKVLLHHEDADRALRREHDDAELAADWRDGGYPYQQPDVAQDLRAAEVPAAGRTAEAAGLGQGHRRSGS